MELLLETKLKKMIAVWENDPDLFEELYSEIDLEEKLFSILGELENQNLWREIEKLDCALQCQPKYYKQYRKHISQALIPLYLSEERENSKDQKSGIEKYLKPFYESPEERSEIFFNILDKLICYDQSSIAVDLCRKTYAQIAQSNDFFINPKYKLAAIIVWDELQDTYIRIKENLNVDWPSYDNKFKAYEFQFTQDDFKSFEEVMKGRLNLTDMVGAFKNQKSLMLFQIKLAFCCQMYDLDGTPFVTSYNFASQITAFLSSIPGREKCSLKHFFKIKPDFLIPHLLKLTESSWFDQTYKQFVFLGALPIFYLVLLKLGIIEMKTIENFLPNSTILKSEYKKIFSDKPWVFNFIKKLENQSVMLVQSYQHSQLKV